jgi:hypothetical protein
LDEKCQSKKVPALAWGQVIQDLSEISFRKNVAIDMDLDATLAKLEPRSIVQDTADTINIASAMDLGSSSLGALQALNQILLADLAKLEP